MFFAAVAFAFDGEAAVADDQLPAFVEIDGRKVGAGFDEVAGFAKDPWVLHRGASDHDAGDGGFAAALDHIASAGDVAIADDRYAHRASDRVDHIPIGLTAVALGAGAAVHGDGAHAAVFEDLCDLDRVDRFRVPAGADFCSDRHLVADRMGDAGCDFRQHGAIFQQ